MPKMTNPHGLKLRDNIEFIFGEEDAKEFECALPLSKSADYLQKYAWSDNICKYLEEKYTKAQIETLRFSCSCHASNKEKEYLRKLYLNAKSNDDFCIQYNLKYGNIHPLWFEKDTLFFSYKDCYCSYVKRVNKQISVTWCLCTLGYTKDLFDFVFESNTTVELIESIKTGGKCCLMKITRK